MKKLINFAIIIKATFFSNNFAMSENIKPKILFFNTTKSWGGGEKWHFDVSQALAARNYEVLVVTNRQSELFKRLSDTKVKLFEFQISNISFLNPLQLLHLTSFFKKEKPDIVIMNLPADLKVAGPAAHLARIKHIIYRRGSAIPISNTLINKFLFRRVVTQVIANSEETKRTILHKNMQLFPKDKIRVLYNGINVEDFDKRQFEPVLTHHGDEVIIGNAGRMVKQKAQDKLMAVAVLLKNKGINFKMVIAGDGKQKPYLLALRKKYNLEDSVIFTGFVDNIKDFLSTIDIFALPSLWEGFGYVLAEAMAASKPIVAFDISSNPELIADKKSGFLVRYPDLDEFAQKIELLIEDKQLRSKMGTEGRKIIEQKFEFNITLQKTIDYINELIINNKD